MSLREYGEATHATKHDKLFNSEVLSIFKVDGKGESRLIWPKVAPVPDECKAAQTVEMWDWAGDEALISLVNSSTIDMCVLMSMAAAHCCSCHLPTRKRNSAVLVCGHGWTLLQPLEPAIPKST